MVRSTYGVTSSLLVAVLMIAMIEPAVGKQKADAKAADSKPTKAKVERKTADAKKPAPRLPPYYGSVVNEDQKEKIATTYTKFNAKLAKLRAEIDEVTAERDKAIEALLTDEQKEKLAELKEEAKAKRARTAAN